MPRFSTQFGPPHPRRTRQWALACLFAALGPGLTFAHILEVPGKRQLTGEEWLRVQQTFYGSYAVVGGIAEVGGLLTSLGIVAVERRTRTSTAWPVVSALAFAAMLGAYWLGNRPLNARIASWAAETIPADWPAVRDRWDTAHTTSAIFAAIALASLLTGITASTRDG